MYYLRCLDRKYSGESTYNLENGKIEETVKCSKPLKIIII